MRHITWCTCAALGPDTRNTAIALGGRPVASAYIVSSGARLFSVEAAMENRRMASQRHTESLKQLADLLSRKTDAEELSETQGMLLGVKKALDNGRYVGAKKDGVERGMPLWMLVRAC